MNIPEINADAIRSESSGHGFSPNNVGISTH